MYLDELKEGLEEQCGTKVDLSTVWRALARSGFTMKKVSQTATKNCTMLNNVLQITKVAKEHCENKCAAYIHHIRKNYVADQLIFVDESAFDRHPSYCGYGWALKGQCALHKSFFM